jgi:hypothetical protein
MVSNITELQPFDLADMSGWFARESELINPEPIRHVVQYVAANRTAFVRWPAKAVLLWDGCNRVAPKGKRLYHLYPEEILKLSKERLDPRSNGPAIAAFRHAGGHRPPRFDSNHEWTVHHLYSGRFKFGARKPTHAVREGKHFTQSAGLVAVHPIADAICDEFASFVWLLRWEAFRLFGYDPDQVFLLVPTTASVLRKDINAR